MSVQLGLTLVCLAALTMATTNNSPCSVLDLASSYDAIVVGAGPAGSVAARRLAEEGHHGQLKILQVERGSYFSECGALCSSPQLQFEAVESPVTGQFIQTTPQTHLPNDQTVSVKDTAVQGGGTSINGMVWIRANGPTYYGEFWPANWNWNTMVNYYIKVENYTYPPDFYPYPFSPLLNLRGESGLIKVTQNTANEENGLERKFIRASQVNFPLIPAFYDNSYNNGYFPGLGVTPVTQSNYNNTRSDAYTNYIGTYTGSNLRSVAHVRVNKVLFEGSSTKVSGVELVFVDPTTNIANSETCTVASSTVIASAGYIGSPKLLMLSGIGPAAELHSLNIPVRVNLPKVGQNLQDHFGVDIFATSVTEITSEPEVFGSLYYNVQSDPNPLTLDNIGLTADVVEPSVEAGYTLALFDTTRFYPTSRGSVTLSSSNPDSIVLLNPNYLATPDDVAILAEGLVRTRNIIRELNFTETTDPCATADCSTPEKQLFAYLSEPGAATPAYHFSATCAINEVVDPFSLQVYGTTGLYVLDASIFPLSPGENTQYTTYAVAERGIELIMTHQRWF